ncbi:PQQ-binding-like beta-propeller repeat protein [Candidatus Neoehrlichia procyonis]|uniref:PQQ enzyme repeat family protein n=1 Tax=Candidatus Neoehrlichia procyonis str. RAC413 TaxID=1359163 RepID=A0A0F3NLP6_9RICK|nr:PQQ-binding-like beta-propeller repeat protein [Candidatus Neoehrlichia lotoris]KJV68970.1 PQQ enzyme repeat family protein [Candidatus Neoehrlichia lotoris str. RAC413]
MFLYFIFNDAFCREVGKMNSSLQLEKDISSLAVGKPEHLNLSFNFNKVKTFLLNGKKIASSIATSNGIVILENTGKLYYLNGKNPNDILWNVSLTNSQKIYGGGLSYAFDKLLYPQGIILCIVDNVLYGVDVSTSKIMWKQVLRNIVDGNPVVINNGKNVAVLTVDNYLFIFNVSDGQFLWSYQGALSDIKKMSSLSPAFNVKNDILTLLLPNGNVIALNSYNGDKLWDLVLNKESFSLVDDISITPITEGDELFIVNYDHDLVSINVLSGQVNWVEKLNVKVVSPIINSNIFIITRDNILVAFNVKNKTIMWKCNLLNKVRKNSGFRKPNKWFSPILTGNKIWVLNDSGYLLKIDSALGVIEKVSNVPKPSYEPMILNFSMYFITKGHGLAVIS